MIFGSNNQTDDHEEEQAEDVSMKEKRKIIEEKLANGD